MSLDFITECFMKNKIISGLVLLEEIKKKVNMDISQEMFRIFRVTVSEKCSTNDKTIDLPYNKH